MILGISGKMRTGKNALADHLCEKYGFVQVAFADKLKQIAMELFGLSREECYGEKTPRSRDILQKVGVAMRGIEEDVWVEYVLKNIPEGKHVVISDVRFKNEANLIKKYGGKVIRVNRKVAEQFGMNHISEIDLDDYTGFEFTISNDGTLEQLYQSIDHTIKELLVS